MAQPTQPPFTHLVVDANAIIANAAVKGLAERYWTVAEALAEVRDSRARQALTTLPFTIETRVPSDECIAAVKAFATKTGDLRTISRTDVLLLALTYQLEKQENGSAYIRTEPQKHETRAARLADFSTHRRAAAAVAECRFYGAPGGCRAGDECRFQHVEARPAGSVAPANVTGSAAEEVEGVPPPEAGAVRPAGAPGEGGGDDAPAGGEGEGAEAAEGADGGDDSEGEWIGPSGEGPDYDYVFPAELPGLGSGSAPSGGGGAGAAGSGPPRKAVACITTDFAMQNVLLQQGLLLASHSGKVITSVKQWVLKCDACFTIFPTGALTAAQDVLFCKRCGNATLARLGVTLGADGTPRYHYKRDRRVNTRGTVYAIPVSKGGRLQDGTSAVKTELLLRPDQLLMGSWKERIRQETVKSNRDSLLADRSIDDRMLEALGTGAGRAAARAGFGGGAWLGPGALGTGTGIPIDAGWGRKNPNSNRTHKNKK